MKKIEKITLDEKQKEIAYCILIVVVLIFLAFGDRIALRFISKNPNPNNTVFGSGEKNKDYKIEFLEELTVWQVLEKINNKETFLLLSSRDSCETCKNLLPDLESVLKEREKNGYYINKDLSEKELTEYQILESLDERLKSHLQYTPYLMYFEEGLLKEEIVGKVEKHTLEDFVKKMKN